MTINIRLNDECGNGHQDFSITGDIYAAGKPRTDRNYIAGGCIHDEILAARPDLQIFVDLHLCDFDGVPMHAVANGLYHMQQGFTNTPASQHKTEFCKYYRVTPEQYDALKKCSNKVQFALALQTLGILAQWKQQAAEAIKMLEQMTGAAFVNDSKRSQYIPPTLEEIAEENERKTNGYYTVEAIAAREQAKKDAAMAKLGMEHAAELKKVNIEYQVKKEVLEKGGEKALKNCIFYNHTQTLCFNWRGYDKMQPEELQPIIENLQLPEGVKVEIENK